MQIAAQLLARINRIEDQVLDDIEARCFAAKSGPWISYVEGRDHSSGSSFIKTHERDGNVLYHAQGKEICIARPHPSTIRSSRARGSATGASAPRAGGNLEEARRALGARCFDYSREEGDEVRETAGQGSGRLDVPTACKRSAQARSWKPDRRRQRCWRLGERHSRQG